MNQVWFRSGIHHHNPEGSDWEEVPVPGEVVQISCGPGDLVWAVLWEGHLLVREGIGRDCIKGECYSTCKLLSNNLSRSLFCLYVMISVYSQARRGSQWNLQTLEWVRCM